MSKSQTAAYGNDSNDQRKSSRSRANGATTEEASPTTETAKSKTKVPMLPPDPEHDIQIQEPGTSGETVQQKSLKTFYEQQEDYLERLRQLKAHPYHQTYLKMQKAVITGAEFKLGVYKLNRKVFYRRHPRYKQALIEAKGENYQLRILGNTQPHTIVRVFAT